MRSFLPDGEMDIPFSLCGQMNRGNKACTPSRVLSGARVQGKECLVELPRLLAKMGLSGPRVSGGRAADGPSPAVLLASVSWQCLLVVPSLSFSMLSL